MEAFTSPHASGVPSIGADSCVCAEHHSGNGRSTYQRRSSRTVNSSVLRRRQGEGEMYYHRGGRFPNSALPGRNQYSHGIIVEVQRRFGFSIHFHSDTQAILDAAQGKIPTPPPMQPNALPEVSDDEDDEDFDMTPSGSASLQMVEKMLSLPGFDAQYLGLQTLSSLVDSEKMTLQTARRVSAALLKPDSKVGQQVFGYITKRNFEESYMSLRVLCLGILANAMRASSIVPEFLRGALRPVLLDDLREAEKFPNAALVAARCMEYFIRGTTILSN